MGLSATEPDVQHTAQDDLLWAECSVPGAKLKFFVVSPYLNGCQNTYFGRLVYVTRAPFGMASIKRLSEGQTWYKVIHRLQAGVRWSVGYEEVLRIAAEYGFHPGRGVHRQLSRIPSSAIDRLQPAPQATLVYPQHHESILSDVARFYAIEADDLRLTGSAAAFRPPYSDLDDIDVVVPVSSEQHLNHIYVSQRPGSAFSVPLGLAQARAFGRPYSSLRWHHISGTVVCPFFVFSELQPPVIEIQSTETRVSGRVLITDARYGIFNTQYYECEGAVSRLMICSTFGRGETPVGTTFNLDCPLYTVTRGTWAGTSVAIANRPYLGLTERHLVGE